MQRKNYFKKIFGLITSSIGIGLIAPTRIGLLTDRSRSEEEIENFYKSHGFETGDVRFPGLDILVRLNPNEYFRNDHLVDNIYNHKDKINQEFNVNSEIKPNSKPNGVGRISGCTRTVNRGNKKGALIYVLNHMEYYTTLHSYGHESTHSLIVLGHEDKLIKELKKEGFGLNPFKEYDNEEDIASIGGLLGIYKRHSLVKDFNDLIEKSFMDETNKFLLKDLLKSRRKT